MILGSDLRPGAEQSSHIRRKATSLRGQSINDDPHRYGLWERIIPRQCCSGRRRTMPQAAPMRAVAIRSGIVRAAGSSRHRPCAPPTYFAGDVILEREGNVLQLRCEAVDVSASHATPPPRCNTSVHRVRTRLGNQRSPAHVRCSRAVERRKLHTRRLQSLTRYSCGIDVDK